MKTTGTETKEESSRPEGEQGTVTVSVSGRAGRILLALLLSPSNEDLLTLSMLANVPRKLLPAYIDELIATVQSPDLGALVDPSNSITDKSRDRLQTEPSPKYLPIDPEEVVEAACIKADQLGDTKAQALALIQAWELFFPEVNKKQELQPRKAKEWIKLVGSSYPGQESVTVFGWLGEVDEARLLAPGMDWPLAWVTKRIANKTAEAVAPQEHETDAKPDGADGISDEWRQYAHKFIEQGARNHVGQNIQTNLHRIAGAVERGSGTP